MMQRERERETEFLLAPTNPYPFMLHSLKLPFLKVQTTGSNCYFMIYSFFFRLFCGACVCYCVTRPNATSAVPNLSGVWLLLTGCFCIVPLTTFQPPVVGQRVEPMVHQHTVRVYAPRAQTCACCPTHRNPG